MEKGPKCAHPSADNQQPLAGRETAGPGRAEPSRAQPILVGADRAPHRTGLHYLQLHLPAITRTLKEEEDVACQCASCSLVSEQRRSAFSALHWNFMYAADAYALQICKPDWYEALLAKSHLAVMYAGRHTSRMGG
ncbi:hypothetical protein VZT92_016035 [Zoarces viviparus]|uniref:Uncharacterized protein n=1 Tax=Zoarces viviparus TaxID=48416 RepID=A0AAW1ESD6_ZOAVI